MPQLLTSITTNKMKKQARQHALSHGTTYKMVDSYYAGSLIDGGGTSCQNCGAIIVNVAIVEDASGTRFSVGMDCAETLSDLMQPLDQWDFKYTHKAAFSEARSFRSKLLGWKKKYANRTIQTTYCPATTGRASFDTVMIDNLGRKQRSWNTFDKETAEKYVLPMVKDLLTVAVTA